MNTRGAWSNVWPSMMREDLFQYQFQALLATTWFRTYAWVQTAECTRPRVVQAVSQHVHAAVVVAYDGTWYCP